jgi:hypothetical protein
MNTLYKAIMDKVVEKTNSDLKSTFEITRENERKFMLFHHTEPVTYLRLLKVTVITMKRL